MTEKLKNGILLAGSVVITIYIAEYLLGFYYTKSILHFPVPAYAIQRHETIDYQVTYRYNNISLRGEDFIPQRLYDLTLLGDSFLFGQGVDDEITIAGIMRSKGYRVLNASEIATQPIDYYQKLGKLLISGLQTHHIVIGLCIGNDFQGIADKQIDSFLAGRINPNPLTYDFFSYLRLERMTYLLHDKLTRLRNAMGRLLSDRHREKLILADFEHRMTFYEDWIRFFTGNRRESMEIMRGDINKPIGATGITEDQYIKQMQLNEHSLENTGRIINAIMEKSKPARCDVLLIPTPSYSFTVKSKTYEQFIARFTHALDPAINIIDLHGRMTKDMHFIHDGHWNERGHRTVADLLMEIMVRP